MGGARCDACLLANVTFPNCEVCDECQDQWRERIELLQTEIADTTSFIVSLNLTGPRTLDIPFFQQLLRLLRNISTLLENSEIQRLSSNVSATHEMACELVDLSEELLRRGRALQELIAMSENASVMLQRETVILMEDLSQLREELSFPIVPVSVPTNSTSYLVITREALERADDAEMLVRVNFTSILREITSLLNVSDTEGIIRERDRDLQSRVDDINTGIVELERLANETSPRLCGGGPKPECGSGCGGLGCGECGGVAGSGCSGLVTQASRALNTSQTALDRAREFFSRLQGQLDELRAGISEGRVIANNSQDLVELLTESRSVAEDLLQEVQILSSAVERELVTNRSDPTEIGRNINATLALSLEILPEEVRGIMTLQASVCVCVFIVYCCCLLLVPWDIGGY